MRRNLLIECKSNSKEFISYTRPNGEEGNCHVPLFQLGRLDYHFATKIPTLETSHNTNLSSFETLLKI